jgi:long-chain acyl-CoA synthetase
MAAVDRYNVTTTGMLVDNLVEVLDHPEAGKYDLRSIRRLGVSSFVKKLMPMSGTEFKILDFETRELKPLGEEGEIVVSSPSLLKLYWNKPEATAQALSDGWFQTGDIGMIDEQGYLHFLGRRKEMLKFKGMSVFSAEIEAILDQHTSVVGSGVIGVEDAELGQAPVAFVLIRPGDRERLTEAELTDWCRLNMANL